MYFSMEEDMMMGKQSFNISNNNNPIITSFNTNNNSSSVLGIRKDSRMVTKVKPKIRIIHIFAPEIIKTDVANFRELVQRLTGKPENSPPQQQPSTTTNHKMKNKSRKNKIPRFSHQDEVMIKKMDHHHNQQQANLMMNVGHEADLYFTFPEMDGFIHDISELPVDASHHHLLPFDQSTR